MTAFLTVQQAAERLQVPDVPQRLDAPEVAWREQWAAWTQRDAARDAARPATRAADRDAERAWQDERLRTYLKGDA